MRGLAKVSILILSVLSLFVGCHDDDSGTVATPDPNPDPPANLSVASFSAVGSSSISDASFSDSDPPGDPPDPVQTPEPTTLFLVGSGLLGLAGLRRKLKK